MPSDTLSNYNRTRISIKYPKIEMAISYCNIQYIQPNFQYTHDMKKIVHVTMLFPTKKMVDDGCSLFHFDGRNHMGERKFMEKCLECSMNEFSKHCGILLVCLSLLRAVEKLSRVLKKKKERKVFLSLFPYLCGHMNNLQFYISFIFFFFFLS